MLVEIFARYINSRYGVLRVCNSFLSQSIVSMGGPVLSFSSLVLFRISGFLDASAKGTGRDSRTPRYVVYNVNIQHWTLLAKD